MPKIPEQTVLVARVAFPDGSLPIRLRERLAEIFADEPFAATFGVRGAPGISPAVLSLVTVLQFAEDLTDRQAAAMAVRAIDWKYAIGAELGDTGFDPSVLSRFRTDWPNMTWNASSSTGSWNTAGRPDWWLPGVNSAPTPPT
ncbi:transposase [Streptomyces sp. NPDC056227]|uniref:transposase n=1 Tax=unclassified Streptomyces TaxID=2593676 RepID=UPI0035DF2B24